MIWDDHCATQPSSTRPPCCHTSDWWQKWGQSRGRTKSWKSSSLKASSPFQKQDKIPSLPGHRPVFPGQLCPWAVWPVGSTGFCLMVLRPQKVDSDLLLTDFALFTRKTDLMCRGQSKCLPVFFLVVWWDGQFYLRGWWGDCSLHSATLL